jgi:hypothetical protein
LEGQQLAWAEGPELTGYDMPAADIPLVEPVTQALQRHL